MVFPDNSQMVFPDNSQMVFPDNSQMVFSDNSHKYIIHLIKSRPVLFKFIYYYQVYQLGTGGFAQKYLASKLGLMSSCILNW